MADLSKRKKIGIIELTSASADYTFKEQIITDSIRFVQSQVTYYSSSNNTATWNYRIANDKWGNAINGTNANGRQYFVVPAGPSQTNIQNCDITISLASGRMNTVEHFNVYNETVPGGTEGGAATFDATHLYKIVLIFEYTDLRDVETHNESY